mmetsp:Transcript_97073/g.273853  ORF Transcript_97073/g.273853 Transcript_97073/m.273853 type:complete len:200 (-) Transcript_97073:44-643(-)
MWSRRSLHSSQSSPPLASRPHRQFFSSSCMPPDSTPSACISKSSVSPGLTPPLKLEVVGVRKVSFFSFFSSLPFPGRRFSALTPGAALLFLNMCSEVLSNWFFIKLSFFTSPLFFSCFSHRREHDRPSGTLPCSATMKAYHGRRVALHRHPWNVTITSISVAIRTPLHSVFARTSTISCAPSRVQGAKRAGGTQAHKTN